MTTPLDKIVTRYIKASESKEALMWGTKKIKVTTEMLEDLRSTWTLHGDSDFGGEGFESLAEQFPQIATAVKHVQDAIVSLTKAQREASRIHIRGAAVPATITPKFKGEVDRHFRYMGLSGNGRFRGAEEAVAMVLNALPQVNLKALMRVPPQNMRGPNSTFQLPVGEITEYGQVAPIRNSKLSISYEEVQPGSYRVEAFLT